MWNCLCCLTAKGWTLFKLVAKVALNVAPKCAGPVLRYAGFSVKCFKCRARSSLLPGPLTLR